ncbi:MAG: ribonuclease III [Oscillospiraceae bacterium]|nr:ribonuclease III [Oscillospiraceae bacterium]
MTDYFSLNLDSTQLRNMNILALAHMGDGVYELLCRGWLCSHHLETIGNLHKATVQMVKAPAQAVAVKKLLPYLTEQESAVYRRGRNANVHQIPKNASRSEYAQATALEALFGWLYLQGQRERINQLFAIIMDESDQLTQEVNHNAT